MASDEHRMVSRNENDRGGVLWFHIMHPKEQRLLLEADTLQQRVFFRRGDRLSRLFPFQGEGSKAPRQHLPQRVLLKPAESKGEGSTHDEQAATAFDVRLQLLQLAVAEFSSADVAQDDQPGLEQFFDRWEVLYAATIGIADFQRVLRKGFGEFVPLRIHAEKHDGLVFVVWNISRSFCPCVRSA